MDRTEESPMISYGSATTSLYGYGGDLNKLNQMKQFFYNRQSKILKDVNLYVNPSNNGLYNYHFRLRDTDLHLLLTHSFRLVYTDSHSGNRLYLYRAP